MLKHLLPVSLLLAAPALYAAIGDPVDLDITVRQLNDAAELNLAERYTGKVLLIVNTASKCGFTGQYEPLESLYVDYKDQGLVVLGFPSNDFGNQEPGTERQIQSFCRLTYGVQFPMFEKTTVKGSGMHPLYQNLIQVSGESPRWNFHKYLIGRDGRLIGSYASQVRPEQGQLFSDIRAALKVMP